MKQPLHDAKDLVLYVLDEPNKIEAMIRRCALEPWDLEILRRVHLRHQTQVEIAGAINMSVETVGRRRALKYMSLEEMKHMNMIHAEIVKVIEAYKREKGKLPAEMLAVWEYKHEEHIEAAEKVAVMQAMFMKI